jgi:hypothetical protein
MQRGGNGANHRDDVGGLEEFWIPWLRLDFMHMAVAYSLRSREAVSQWVLGQKSSLLRCCKIVKVRYLGGVLGL